MKSKQSGFSVVEALLFVVVLVLLVGLSYTVYHRRQAKTTTTASQAVKTTVPAAIGTTQSIDNLTAQDISSESAIDTSHANSETTAAQSANAAASNIGGAYNESSL